MDINIDSSEKTSWTPNLTAAWRFDAVDAWNRIPAKVSSMTAYSGMFGSKASVPRCVGNFGLSGTIPITGFVGGVHMSLTPGLFGCLFGSSTISRRGEASTRASCSAIFSSTSRRGGWASCSVILSSISRCGGRASCSVILSSISRRGASTRLLSIGASRLSPCVAS